MDIFSLNPPTILSQGGKWLLAVTSFELINSVFNKTDENNGFSKTSTNFWRPLG